MIKMLELKNMMTEQKIQYRVSKLDLTTWKRE